MADLSILQHALGVDQYGRGAQYRRHLVTGPGSVDFDTCVDLVGRGLMERREGSALTGGDDCFLVTSAGRTWMAENSPAPPKLTRSQQRYQDYLDADSGLRFGEWLRCHEARRKAAAELPF